MADDVKAEAMLTEYEANPGEVVRDARFEWLDRFAKEAARAWADPPVRVAAPLQALAELCWARGEGARAHELASRAIEILGRHLPPTDAEWLRARGRRATWHALAGDWSAADVVLREAAAAVEATNADGERSLALAVIDGLRAEVEYERGRFAQARRRCVEGLSRFDDGLDEDNYRSTPALATPAGGRAAAVALDLWAQLFAVELALGRVTSAGACIDRSLSRWGSGVGPAARRCIEARRVTLALHTDDVEGAARSWRATFQRSDGGPRSTDPVDGSGRRAAAVQAQLEGMIAQRRLEHGHALSAFERAVSHRRPRHGRAGLFDPSEDLGFAPLEHALMGVSLAHLGRTREAQVLAGEALALSRRVPLRRDLRWVILRSFGEVMGLGGESETARAALTDAHVALRARFDGADPRVRRVREIIERLG